MNCIFDKCEDCPFYYVAKCHLYEPLEVTFEDIKRRVEEISEDDDDE